MSNILFCLLFSSFTHMGHVHGFILFFSLKMLKNIWCQFFQEVEIFP